MPPRWIPFEPEVRPWLGVSAVSPSIYFDLVDTNTEFLGGNLRNGDAQPLAEIDLAAVHRHGAVAVHGQKGIDLLGVEHAGRAGYALCGDAVGPPVSAKPTVSAPPLRSARREKRDVLTGAFMSASLSRCRHHRAHDPHMGPAAAEVHLKRRANVVLAGFAFFGQQCGRAHDHAARAVAALRHLLIDEGGLDRMRFCRRPESFERGDRLALRIRDSHLAGLHRRAVDQDGAGAALAKPAAELCRRQAEATQHIEQRLIGVR